MPMLPTPANAKYSADGDPNPPAPIIKALELNNLEPKIYELGGPENYSFKELMNILLTEIKKKNFIFVEENQWKNFLIVNYMFCTHSNLKMLEKKIKSLKKIYLNL